MRFSRRRFGGYLGATLAAAGGLTAGCSSRADGLTVAFYGATNLTKAMKAALGILERKHPELRSSVEPGTFTGYYDKLATRFGAGSAPDVVMNDFTHLAGYAERGALLDLARYVPDPINTALARPTAFDGGRAGAGLFGVPIGTHTQAMLANRALVPQATSDQLHQLTWDSFAELTTDIGRAGGGRVFGTEDGGSRDFLFDVWVRQRGGQLFTPERALGFTEDDLVAWFDYWQRLRTSSGAVPIDLSVDPTVTPLVLGRAAFGYSFSSYTGVQAQTEAELTVLPVPAGRAGDVPGCFQYVKPTNLYSVNAKTPAADRSVALASAFLTDPDVGGALGITLGSPPSRQVFDSLRAKATGVAAKVLDFDARIQKVATATSYPPPRPTGADQLLTSTSALLNRLNQAIAYRQLSPAEGARQFVEQARSYLQP